jgi:hypothetical protein
MYRFAAHETNQPTKFIKMRVFVNILLILLAFIPIVESFVSPLSFLRFKFNVFSIRVAQL